MKAAWAPEKEAANDGSDELSRFLADNGVFAEATRVALGGDRGEPLTAAEARAALRKFI